MSRPATHPNAHTSAPALLSGGATSYQLSRPAAWGIWLFGLTMLLPWLGSSRALTYHEIVFAEPAREMLATGEFIVPRIAGVPFTDKPPLMAWLIASAMAVFQSQAEWVVRLPSVLAAIGTAWWIAFLAARWFGSRLGTLAGFMHLTTLHVMMQARLAECDTLLGLAVAGALGCFGLAMVDSPRGRVTGRAIIRAFYACAAAAFMTKFLAGPLFIVAGVGAFTLLDGRWRDVLRWLLDPVGILLALLLTVPWCVAAYLEYPGILDNVLYHNVGRFSGAMERNEPPWGYLYLVPFVMLPWSPWMIVGLVQAVRQGLHHDSRWRLLAAWSLGGIGALSLAAFKAKHYTIPALAPLAVFSAYGLLAHLHWRQRAKSHATWLSMAAIVLGVSGGWFALGKLPRISADERLAIGVALTIIAGGLTAVVIFERRRQLLGQCIAGLATAWCVSLVIQSSVIPFHDSYRHQSVFAAEINAQRPVDSPETLHLVGLPENQITFYLQGKLASEHDPLVFLREQLQPARSGRLELLAPRWIAELCARYGQIEVQDRCAGLNRYQTDAERVTWFHWTPDSHTLSELPAKLTPPLRR